jgi:hypothetical protein
VISLRPLTEGESTVGTGWSGKITSTSDTSDTSGTSETSDILSEYGVPSHEYFGALTVHTVPYNNTTTAHPALWRYGA